MACAWATRRMSDPMTETLPFQGNSVGPGNAIPQPG